ncbi:CDP-alcohol phosphatidyltransferase family protein [Nocardioides baekrokdamisoli]
MVTTQPRSGWSLPNTLTVVRLLTIPIFVWLVLSHQRHLYALGVLVVAGATDFFDGWLARRTGNVTRIGELLDPIVDRLFILAAAVTLWANHSIPAWLAAMVLLRDVFLWTLVPLLRSRRVSSLPVHYLGKAATFNLLYAFPLLLLANGHGAVHEIARTFAWAFTLWGVGLYWWVGIIYARQVASLIRSVPSPRRGRRVA